jgi:ABC-type lipoprotein release transport system permease subunit
MKFLPILALSWKNIWRNRTRSLVVIVAVILGTGAGVFMSAFMLGMSLQMVRSELENFVAHIQIHTKEYRLEPLPEYVIPAADSLIDELRANPAVAQVAPRTVINGLAASSATSYGVNIKGVYPDQEKKVSQLYTYMVEGDYFETRGRNPVLIGQKLADRLNVGVRSKIVLNFQDVDGNLAAAAFRVSGIFKSPNSVFDESNVFVEAETINGLIAQPGAVHEIAVITKNFKSADSLITATSFSDNLIVESWGDLSPSLRYTDEMVGTMLYIVMVIILIALTFGIINTMLMAVLERQQELGMLMAVGVNRLRTFTMILFETFFLAVFGAPLGLFLAWLGITLLEDTGINVSAFAEGFELYGFGTIIYPELEAQYYFNITLLILIVTMLASIFPAYKALKLNPVEAIRKI